MEDSPEDAEMVRNSLLEDPTPNSLHHVSNGAEAMKFLRKEGEFAGAPDIELILLDLNMPVMDGHETLEHIAQDPDLRHLPVVVLSVLSDSDAISDVYRKRCNSFIQKPIGYDVFREMIHQITRYWSSIAKIPRRR